MPGVGLIIGSWLDSSIGSSFVGDTSFSTLHGVDDSFRFLWRGMVSSGTGSGIGSCSVGSCCVDSFGADSSGTDTSGTASDIVSGTASGSASDAGSSGTGRFGTDSSGTDSSGTASGVGSFDTDSLGANCAGTNSSTCWVSSRLMAGLNFKAAALFFCASSSLQFKTLVPKCSMTAGPVVSCRRPCCRLLKCAEAARRG